LQVSRKSVIFVLLKLSNIKNIQMISKERFNKLLFFDIETAGQYKDYFELSNHDRIGAKIWEKKWELYLKPNTDSLEESYSKSVAIYPEFGRIVCLSYGVYKDGEMTVKTISSESESEMMKLIYQLFARAGERGMTPIGWNIKQFDIPWINRRLMANGLSVPNSLDTFEKKPWEVSILDLRDMWRGFSTFPCTFEEAAYAMGVPTPKDDIDGSQVHSEFWKGNVDRIVTYCEKDVKTMIELLKKMSNIE